MNSSPQKTPAKQAARRKRWVFRACAVLVGIALFAVWEFGLSLAGVGEPDYTEDPFVGFSEVHPLFVKSDDGERYRIPKSRFSHFRPESFPARKPKDAYRIFVLGGSTVQGRPYAIETSFTTWLELCLKAAAPSREWNVVNCGGVSYASYRLVPILQEVLGYEADLIVVCTGQNEFLEERAYESIKHLPAWLAWPQHRAARLRTFVLLRSLFHGEEDNKRPVLGPEADARLDWAGGLAKYHRDDEWQADVVLHYEANLRRMAGICSEADVPLLFMSPVSSLDWAPFKAEHREDITPAERTRFNSLWDEATAAYDRDIERSLELLERAVEIDGRHAGILYATGQTLKTLNRLERAKEYLIRAKDEDVCPLRMLESMHRILEEVAAETGTPFFDTRALFAGRSPAGIIGDEWLVDHCHPSIEGHQAIAQTLLLKLAAEGILTPRRDWRQRMEAAFEEHLASIDRMYFIKGKQRNAAVQRWARGEATDVRTDKEE